MRPGSDAIPLMDRSYIVLCDKTYSTKIFQRADLNCRIVWKQINQTCSQMGKHCPYYFLCSLPISVFVDVGQYVYICISCLVSSNSTLSRTLSASLRTVPTFTTSHTFLSVVPTNTGIFLRGLKLWGESRTQQVLLVSKMKIGGNHAFFRDNKASFGKKKKPKKTTPYIVLYFTAF